MRSSSEAAGAFWRGWSRVLLAPALILAVWLATILTALPAALTLHDAIGSQLGNSMTASRVAAGAGAQGPDMANLDDPGRRRPPKTVDADVTLAMSDPGFERERWLAFATMAVMILLWEWASRSGAISRLFFPPPTEVARALWRSIARGDFRWHLQATLLRVLFGVVIGGVPGLLLGLVLGWSPRLRAYVDPFVATLHPIPKLAVLPMIMMIFGLGEASKVVVVAAGVFFPMLLTSMAGVRQIQGAFFDIAAVYGATRAQMFRHVVVPGSLPFVLTGLRLAFNIGLLIALAVELLTAQRGLGKMIWLAWETMRIEDLYAALVVIAALGIGFNLFLSWLSARLVPWHGERTR